LHSYGLSADECILGATRNAAASLGLAKDTGSIQPDLSADMVVWNLPHEHAILQPWGASMTRLVVRAGRILHHVLP